MFISYFYLGVKPSQVTSVVALRAMGTPAPLWAGCSLSQRGLYEEPTQTGWHADDKAKSAWCQLLVSPGLQATCIHCQRCQWLSQTSESCGHGGGGGWKGSEREMAWGGAAREVREKWPQGRFPQDEGTGEKLLRAQECLSLSSPQGRGYSA